MSKTKKQNARNTNRPNGKKAATAANAGPETADTKRSLILVLRALGAFVLLGLLIVVLYRWGYDSYKDVAEWVEPGNHEAFIYNGETYSLMGQIGKNGLTKSKYPMDKILGQVKDGDTPVTTEPVTTAEPDTEEDEYFEDEEFWDETDQETETEIESVNPPAGAELFEDVEHAYILYTVENREDFLILLEKDGEYYLYSREGENDSTSGN